jgi:hypothetical protein
MASRRRLSENPPVPLNPEDQPRSGPPDLVWHALLRAGGRCRGDVFPNDSPQAPWKPHPARDVQLGTPASTGITLERRHPKVGTGQRLQHRTQNHGKPPKVSFTGTKPCQGRHCSSAPGATGPETCRLEYRCSTGSVDSSRCCRKSTFPITDVAPDRAVNSGAGECEFRRRRTGEV